MSPDSTRLSGDEFDRRLVALHERATASAAGYDSLEARRLEFDLVIDHRLGTDFPAERRERLHVAKERFDRSRWRPLVAVASVAPFGHRLASAVVWRLFEDALDRTEAGRLFGFSDETE